MTSEPNTIPEFTSFNIRPLTGSLGAEILDTDLSHASDEEIAQVQQALDHYHVLAIRDQKLDPNSFHKLARRFGPFSGNPVHVPLEGFDDLVRFTREAEDRGPVVGEDLHMDLAWMEIPPGTTILYGEEIPPVGGDTMFASLSAAYEGLSDAMRDLIHNLVGVHSGKGVFALNASHATAFSVKESGQKVDDIETAHPLVCRHPNTGRKHLYISRALCRFVGMTEAESKPIIDYLITHAQKVEYACRLRWAPNTLTMWANTCLMHAAINDYSGQRRVVLRTTVAGARPLAAGD
ncbi:TauD/TfdA family dioxygenase [Opitutia bacterium ISCC 51]|nr:TauD/TfdA family dioxygenase [Opitutae bacterium ISCC 51]QXD27202.1 TauD/TfdA family dioxygenase [Opitutae bacterium ISCC 52]